MQQIDIHPFAPVHWPAVWQMLRAVFRAGESYMFAPDISEEEAYHIWITLPSRCYVALRNHEIVATYYLKPNQPALGAHICNCGYVVAKEAQGYGIATQLCLHSQEQARKMGFRGMQFNAVVSSNHRAVALWKRLGFETLGRVPEGFLSPQGYVDTYIMYKSLV